MSNDYETASVRHSQAHSLKLQWTDQDCEYQKSKEVSFAYIVVFRNFDDSTISFIYNKNNTGPVILPCEHRN